MFEKGGLGLLVAKSVVVGTWKVKEIGLYGMEGSGLLHAPGFATGFTS